MTKREENKPIREFVRDEMLDKCPDLAAHLFDLEQMADPFFLGLSDYDDDYDDPDLPF